MKIIEDEGEETQTPRWQERHTAGRCAVLVSIISTSAMIPAHRLSHERNRPMLAIEACSDLPLFRQLPLEVLSKFQQLSSQRTFKAGAKIRIFEHPLEFVYIILRGTIKIRTWHNDYSESVMMIAGKGDMIGTLLYAPRIPYIEKAEAAMETTLLWLSNQDFESLLRNSSLLSNNLVQILTKRFRTVECHLHSLLRFDVARCLAYQLHYLVQEYGQPQPTGDCTIPFALTQSDLASLIGASRVRVNKILMDFKRRGILSMEPNHQIVIHNVHLLEAMCH